MRTAIDYEEKFGEADVEDEEDEEESESGS